MFIEKLRYYRCVIVSIRCLKYCYGIRGAIILDLCPRFNHHFSLSSLPDNLFQKTGPFSNLPLFLSVSRTKYNCPTLSMRFRVFVLGNECSRTHLSVFLCTFLVFFRISACSRASEMSCNPRQGTVT